MSVRSSQLLLSLVSAPLAAQQSPSAEPSPFQPLELPAPTAVRTGSGAPGPGYWQQRVNYEIKASLDTAGKSLTGEERIVYSNNSPDTLRYVWLQLDQNLFNDHSRGFFVFGQDPRFGSSGAQVSVRLNRVAEPAVPPAKGKAGRPATPLEYTVNGTMMRIDLARPLPPKGKQALELGWSFPFGPNGNRMGLEEIDGSTVYEVAQWYPGLAPAGPVGPR